MPNRKKEINPEKGKRLDEVLKHAGITAKELATLMSKPHQNIYDLLHSKRNLTEEMAKDIVIALDKCSTKHLPSYRWQYLLAIDNHMTIVEEVLARRKDDIDNLEQILFVAMAEQNHHEVWELNDFVSDSEIVSNEWMEFIRTHRGSVGIKINSREINIPKDRLEVFMKRILDYFEFELQHFEFKPDTPENANPAR